MASPLYYIRAGHGNSTSLWALTDPHRQELPKVKALAQTQKPGKNSREWTSTYVQSIGHPMIELQSSSRPNSQD